MGKVERLTNSTTGGPVFVDVKDGKILRITPMDLDDTDAALVVHRGKRADIHSASADYRHALHGGS